MGQNVFSEVVMKVYESADFFLIRTALLPLKNLEPDLESLFAFYHSSSLFQEAIAVASPSLHRSMQNHPSGEEKRKELFPSLLKYYLRMCSRATPFGLFSAVGWGQFGASADLKLRTETLRRKAAPDGEWIHAFIQNLEAQIESVRSFKVRVNPNLIKKLGRVFLREKKGTAAESFSIKSTLVSDTLFSYSKTPILFADLEAKLFETFDEHPKERISSYLWQLFQKRYLLSENTLCLTQTGALQKILENDPLAKALDEYEAAPFGQGVEPLEKACQHLARFKEIPHPLQVDSYYESDAFRLPSSVKERVEEIVDLFWHSAKSSRPALEKYQKQFQEKYGVNRLVPLLELADPHLGLGIPAPEIPVPPQQSSSSDCWKKQVLSLLKNRTVELAPPAALSKEETLQKAPLSFELYFELLASSEKKIEEGDYTLVVSPMGSSLQAGGTFGRFLPLFHPDQKERLRQLLQKEESLDSETLFVEATFFPESPRGANIVSHETLRAFRLQMHYHESEPQSIEPEDIYVGASRDQLYLYSKKEGKRLQILLGSAANPLLTPPLLQFLLEVSKSRFSYFSPFLWTGAENEEFLPRLTYKNAILSPARWRLIAPPAENANRQIPTILKERLVSLDVPAWVYLTVFDNRILVNWKNEDHFQLLAQHWAAKKELVLYESYATEENLPAASEKGRHVAEFVVPCVRKDPLPSLASPYPSCAQIDRMDRFCSPGSEWLYLKIFLSRENEEEFLVKQLQGWIQDLLQKAQIGQWFYVRYREEKFHLRVRLKGIPKTLLQEVLPAFHRQAAQWMGTGLIEDWSLHSYEKEVERYGGPDSLEFAEELFSFDSLCCLQILQNAPSFDLPLPVWGALCILNLVQGASESAADQTAFFSHFQIDKKGLAGIREHSGKALKIASALLSDSVPVDPFLASLQALFGKIRALASPLFFAADEIWTDKKSLLRSLIHMHCNRLLGIDPETEIKALAISQYLFEKRIYQMTHKENLCKA